ncbi:putative PE family protein, partial [Mycobacterium tuberculosis SUMu008]
MFRDGDRFLSRSGPVCAVHWSRVRFATGRRVLCRPQEVSAMSFVVTAPPVLASAASDLGGIASMISEANAMAAVRTTALAPAAADEVSAAIAALFSSYARDYQTLSVQVTAFHVQFAQTLTNAGQLYAVVDVGNGVLLKTEQQVLGVINAPTQTLVGRPLIGDGTHGAPGTGQNGGAGGILWGNGGNGGSGAPGQPGGR